MNKKQLIKKISILDMKIKNLHLHPATDDMYSELYNTLILEKAVLKKDLENLNSNKFILKFKDMFVPHEKLICDYWKK